MSHTIKIGDDSYVLLAEQAAQAGLAPEVWVERKIRESLPKKKKITEKRRREAWKNFVGAVNSLPDATSTKGPGKGPLPKRVKNVFGNVVEEKMKRIGLKLPK